MADNTPKNIVGPNPTVVAKFTVTERTELQAGGYGIKMQAVYGNSPENQRFFQFTPNASIELRTVNPGVAAQFDPGKELYATFSEQVPHTQSEQLAVEEAALVSFGNYLLKRFDVYVMSNDGMNDPIYQRQVTHADLCNWRDEPRG